MTPEFRMYLGYLLTIGLIFIPVILLSAIAMIVCKVQAIRLERYLDGKKSAMRRQ